MTLDDHTVSTQLDPIRALQQSGDHEAARAALDSLCHEGIRSHPACRSIYGVILILCGDSETGKKIIESITSISPRFSSWASDLGFGLLLTGHPDLARQHLECATHLKAPDATAFNRLGTVCLLADNLQAAQTAFANGLARDPGKAEIHSNLGGVMVRLGQFAEALSHYEKALSIDPDLPQAKTGKYAILLELEQTETAVLDIEEDIEKERNPEIIRNKKRYLAALLHSAGRFEEATHHLRSMIIEDPADIQSLIRLAGFLADRSMHHAAIAVLQQAAKAEPENMTVLSLMAKSFTETGKPDKALACVETLFSHHPEEPAAFLSRASVYSSMEKHEDAEKDLRHITENFPGMVDGWGLLGHHLMTTGRLDEAVQCFETASCLNPFSFSNLIEARVFPDNPKILEKLETFARNPLHHTESRAAISFSLSKVFEKKESFDKAFDFSEMGNRLAMRTHVYHEDRYIKMAKTIKSVFNKDMFQKFKGGGSPSTRPVFIVGMPRSGTTLTEQIIASHPDVFGAGELGIIPTITALMPRVIKTKTPYPDCLGLFQKWMAGHAASCYLKKIYAMNQTAKKVTDKLPHNFMHLGLIGIMFPEAKIIHVSRDKGDVAVSNYFTNFRYKDGIMGFAFDLGTIARMIKMHDELMAHFKTVLPMPVFDLSYESVIENPEQTARDLLSFLDLPWNDRVLDFHQTKRAVKTASVWQVRQPVYQTSKKRWKNYETHLKPFFEAFSSPG
ncbi:MAG: sulfotransferase [Proteobacteria bacterium]|nr:sulfotransferase [Pseudomonadota bacterium]